MTRKTFDLKILSFLDEAHRHGFAVAIFTPEELESVSPELGEECMIERGWDAIHYNKAGEARG